ncbi:MAG: endonuclease/exonuclease/phosphatase family protein [Flavobacteriaceae bacterium]
MKLKILITLASILLLASCAKSTLHVISYNIRYNNPNDGDNHWDFRKETIANFILKEQPDVFGMQEVTHLQLLDLIEEWSEYDYLGVGREDGMTKGEYSPVFYKTEKYKVLAFDTFWLSETPDTISVGWDAALERICSYAHLEAHQNKKRFWIFNTHFDHRGELARAEAVKLLLKTIKQLNVTNDPVVVTGDFNLTPDTSPIGEITSLFEDAYTFTKDPKSKQGTYNGFDATQFGDRRIDYIFTQRFSVKEAAHVPLKTPWEGWASDHHPVQAKLNY